MFLLTVFELIVPEYLYVSLFLGELSTRLEVREIAC